MYGLGPCSPVFIDENVLAYNAVGQRCRTICHNFAILLIKVAIHVTFH
jgi:hypothetical protein